MHLDLWGIHSILEIKRYSLAFKIILMILALNKVYKMKKMDFLQNLCFRGAIREKIIKSKEFLITCPDG